MAETKTYTAKDIERYHKGEMSPAEMHLLEKAALEDPMLADALEGYSFTTTATADLQLLQNKLQQRTEGGKKRSLFFLSSQWLKIAALFIVIAGGGWLVFQTFSSKQNTIATNNPDRLSKQ